VSDLDRYVMWAAVGAITLYLAAVSLALYCLALPFLGLDPI